MGAVLLLMPLSRSRQLNEIMPKSKKKCWQLFSAVKRFIIMYTDYRMWTSKPTISHSKPSYESLYMQHRPPPAAHDDVRPGKELLIADTLSRTSLPDVADELEFRQYDIDILHTLPITEPKLAKKRPRKIPGSKNWCTPLKMGGRNTKRTHFLEQDHSGIFVMSSHTTNGPVQRCKSNSTYLHASRNAKAHPRLAPGSGQV